MKKFFSWMMLATALIGVACNQEKSEMEGGKQLPTMTITASIDGECTRTVLDGFKVLWKDYESFTASNGTETVMFSANVYEPSATAEFECYDTPLTGDAFLAVYPYVKEEVLFDVENKTISGIQINDYQTPAAESFDCYAATMVAYSTTTDFNFRNAHSLAKFTVASEGVSKVTLKADAALAGAFTVNAETMEIVNEGSYSSIEVRPYEGGDFIPNVTYYVALIPGTKTNFQLLVNDIVIKEVETATFERNKIHNMGQITAVESGWEFKGTINNWGNDYKIPFYDQKGNFYIAKNITLNEGDEFKVNKGDVWQGCNYSNGDKTSKVMWMNSGNNTVVSAGIAGTYDIYMHKSEEFFVLISNPEDFLTVIGNGSWENDCAQFYLNDGIFVAYNVELTGAEFKLRANKGWIDSWGKGSMVPYQAQEIDYNGSNMTIPAGTYNIYTDLKKIWFANPEDEIPTISY